MIYTFNEAKIEFEAYAQKEILNMCSSRSKLEEKIKIYKEKHPNLVPLLIKDHENFCNQLKESVSLWNSSDYSKFRKIRITRGEIDITKKLKERNFIKTEDIFFENWLAGKYPSIYFREFKKPNPQNKYP
jgi:hypothetical protein